MNQPEKFCSDCESTLEQGWDDGWFWCPRCKKFYWHNKKEHTWHTLSTAEAQALIYSGTYARLGFSAGEEEYNNWMVKQVIEISKAGFAQLPELMEDYGKNIPDEQMDELSMKIAKAIMNQLYHDS